MERSIKDLITDKISGEWGVDAAFGEGVKVIRTANFTNLGVIDFKNIVFRKIDGKKVRHKKLRKGDVIIEKSGGSPTQPVGRVVFFDIETNEEYLCNNFTTILRPDRTKIYPKYFFYQLFIGHIRGRTLKFQNKTTGIINLKLDNYLNEKILVPPIDDQIRIAQTLSKIEGLIIKRKESLDLFDNYILSTFSSMFGLGQSSEFQIRTLNDVSKKITDGEHGTVKRLDSGKLYLMARNVTTSNTLDFTNVSYISEESHRKIFNRCNPEKGDLLMVCVGATIGKVALVPEMEEFSLARSVALIKPDAKLINSRYLLWFFNSDFGIRQIKNGSNEAAQAGLYTGNLKKINIPVPPIKLQNKFSSIVEKIEILKEKCQESLNELENLFASLSQKAFKGDIDLRKVVIDEEWHNFEGNEPEEQDPVKRKKIKKYFENELKKVERGDYDHVDQRYGDPFDTDEITAKNKGRKFYSEWKKLHPKKPKSKLTWDKVSSQQIAEWVKDKYQGYHFSNEMLIRFLMDEHVTFPDYYSSEELKKHPHLNGADDLKSFVFSAVSKENPFIELEQLFYDAEKENIQLNVSEEDFELIKDRNKKERSGIYFSITK